MTDFVHSNEPVGVETRAIVAFEGGVCSGKSVAMREIAHRYGWLVVPEDVDWILERGRPMPQGSAEQRLTQYLQVEQERAIVVSSRLVNCAVDRSFLSLLSF